MAAFALALEEGADGIELDVRLDGEGNVVVIHDPALGRVTSGRDTRNVADLDAREFATIDLGGGERVPRLDAVLRWARQRRTRVNVELKHDVPSRPRLVLAVIRSLLRELSGRDRVILSSFDPLIVAALSRSVPWLPTGWLVEERVGIPARSLGSLCVGASALHPRFTLVSADSIEPWQRSSAPVNVWTVNAADEARRLDALGVDTLITDEPGRILEALSRRGG
jgi:glycerophosphoryl diester phosphodiesterase